MPSSPEMFPSIFVQRVIQSSIFLLFIFFIYFFFYGLCRAFFVFNDSFSHKRDKLIYSHFHSASISCLRQRELLVGDWPQILSDFQAKFSGISLKLCDILSAWYYIFHCKDRFWALHNTFSLRKKCSSYESLDTIIVTHADISDVIDANAATHLQENAETVWERFERRGYSWFGKLWASTTAKKPGNISDSLKKAVTVLG